MAATTSTSRHDHQRSLSPSGRFCASSISSSSFTSSSPSLHRQPSLFHRSSSPTRVTIHGTSSQQTTSSLFRFSIDNRPKSPNNSFTAVSKNRTPFPPAVAPGKKKTCLCSPTTHPGSFRCSYHKNLEAKRLTTASYQPNRLNMRRSAMTNSLVRIGSVEGGESVKRALATLIRPCAHQQRRRGDFQPRPSRLSVMSKAGDHDR